MFFCHVTQAAEAAEDYLGLVEERRIDRDIDDLDGGGRGAGRLGSRGIHEPLLKVGRIPNLTVKIWVPCVAELT